MALQQRPPLHLTKIQWPAGDWLVVSIKLTRENFNGSYKLNDYDNYQRTSDPELEEFPFNASKPSSYKAPTLKDHETWRGHNNNDDADTFTALYFVHLEKAQGQKTIKLDSIDDIKLEFPKLSKAQQDSGIAYYVWPSDNNDPTRDYLPQPDKDQALGFAPPSVYWPPNTIWIAFYNNENSWYESWSPGLRAQLGGLIGYAAFDALKRPDNIHFGWSKQEDRDAFLAAFNQLTAWSQNGNGAYHDYWPLPTYYSFEIDWSEGQPPPGETTAENVEINVYRIKRNNIVYDAENAIKGKLPAIGKDHKTYSFRHEAPTDPRTVTIHWTKEDGISISG